MEENPYQAPQPDESSSARWWHIGSVRPTRQYIAGGIGGVGVGFVLMKLIQTWLGEIGVSTAAILIAPFLVFIGTFLAYHDQHRSP